MSEFQDKIKKYFENQKQFEWFTAWVAAAEKETERTTGVLSQSLRQSIEEADLNTEEQFSKLRQAFPAMAGAFSSPPGVSRRYFLSDAHSESHRYLRDLHPVAYKTEQFLIGTIMTSGKPVFNLNSREKVKEFISDMFDFSVDKPYETDDVDTLRRRRSCESLVKFIKAEKLCSGKFDCWTRELPSGLTYRLFKDLSTVAINFPNGLDTKHVPLYHAENAAGFLDDFSEFLHEKLKEEGIDVDGVEYELQALEKSLPILAKVLCETSVPTDAIQENGEPYCIGAADGACATELFVQPLGYSGVISTADYPKLLDFTIDQYDPVARKVIFKITETINLNLCTTTLPYVRTTDGVEYNIASPSTPEGMIELSIYDKNHYINLPKLDSVKRRFERYKAINELARQFESKQLTEGDVK